LTMYTEYIVMGIGKAPLNSDAKEEILNYLQTNRQRIEAYLSRFPSSGSAVKLMNYPGDISKHMIAELAPILQKHGVSPGQGRDTARHIYVSLGGKNKITFECM